MQINDFKFTIKSLFFDENYLPNDTTRITTNFVFSIHQSINECTDYSRNTCSGKTIDFRRSDIHFRELGQGQFVYELYMPQLADKLRQATRAVLRATSDI